MTADLEQPAEPLRTPEPRREPVWPSLRRVVPLSVALGAAIVVFLIVLNTAVNAAWTAAVERAKRADRQARNRFEDLLEEHGCRRGKTELWFPSTVNDAWLGRQFGPTSTFASLSPENQQWILRDCSFSDTRVTGRGVASVSRWLRRLRLNGLPLGDGDLESATRDAPQLWWLEIPDTKVTAAGLLALATNRPEISHLDVAGLPLSDVRVFHQFAQLTYLDLSRCPITDEELLVLADHPTLEYLQLRDVPDITVAGVEAARLRNPRIQFDHYRITHTSNPATWEDLLSTLKATGSALQGCRGEPKFDVNEAGENEP